MSGDGPGFKIGLAGATGTLGQEVLAVLGDRRFPISDLVAFSTERSIGEEVEYCGENFPVATELPPLRGLDLLIVCTPRGPALDLVREALRAEVPMIDCSGVLAGSDEVPIYVADLCSPDSIRKVPAVASPAGVALAWSHVLAAVEGAAGIERVVGTTLYSATRAGRAGIEALSEETVKLLNQQVLPDSDVFPARVAFDCFPLPAESEPEGDRAASLETEVMSDLRRLVSKDLKIAATAIQVPMFAGEGTSLAIETRRPLTASYAREVFEKAPGLELWDEDDGPLSTRDTAGRDVAVVTRIRPNPSCENGILLWVAADTLRLAAVNTAKIAETRLEIA
jgi:aspartate-semialdehyde dehydrogenase